MDELKVSQLEYKALCPGGIHLEDLAGVDVETVEEVGRRLNKFLREIKDKSERGW